MVTNYDKFFVFYLARDCTRLEPWASQHCRSISEADLPDYDPTVRLIKAKTLLEKLLPSPSARSM